MAGSIIHFLFFEICFSIFEPDLDLLLQIVGLLSRGLPSYGAISLPRGLPSFEARCFRPLQGGEARFSQVNLECGMLQ